MPTSERISPARFWRGIGVTALVAMVLVGGCDWFDAPVEANWLPHTSMVSCPADGETAVGEDVVLRWSGVDLDGSADVSVEGSVAYYEWTLDDTLSGQTTETSMTVKDVTGGVHTFTVAAVDVDGEADATPAGCTFSVTQGGFLVARVVLAEMLTTKLCPNCPTAEQALDQLIGDYGADEFCVITYHFMNEQYSDPVATDESVERIQWYYSNHEGPNPDSNEDDVGNYETVYPLVIFDGGRFVVGATTVNAAKANYWTEIEHRRAVMSPISLSLEGDISGGGGSVSVTVRVHDSLGAGPNVLRIVVIEDGIVMGSDHFDFVARDILDREVLAVSAAGESVVVVREFIVDPGWNIENMDVIAFVQDDSTLEIVQAGRLLIE
ncbi:MAG: hypothetical protein ABIE42_06800 [Candidatus Eisenbacteria bacterium]